MRATQGLAPTPRTPLAWAIALLGGVVALVVVVGAGAYALSFKGTDSGTVCVVREGGPFDGRAVKEVRQPGEGPKAIGAFNHQDCLPTTERDSNDVLEEDPTFPTRDSVQVVADGQALFSLTTDPSKIATFYKKYGRRTWNGEEISTEAGWVNFLRQRLAPVLLDTQRQVIGQYECIQLNNLCQYVQNAEAVTTGDVKKVDNQQNLAQAQGSIAEALKGKLRSAFGDDYFENVRFQNLRIRFESEVQRQITNAQSLRTQAANARLEADRRIAETKGAADAKVAEAEGSRRAAFQQEKAYRANPTQRDIDKIRAFCGADGCDPRVMGGNLDGILADISK
ncbi:MAG: hypothetical protein AVDCRST_MAG53-565 [uncultured Solirubrobacteraceae bacterium]|uniref:Band 7 domain-containing protein n=1 Tax=uncultured Solirubrobacteraceae bacterium TaxID=1162706 RepID=A0A6J4RSJ5_9ACTN|nr:MAG: hypothetical protein AVDCRST_MAG53-565 [uncultured Solirubrobacteraceae bacterium]